MWSASARMVSRLFRTAAASRPRRVEHANRTNRFGVAYLCVLVLQRWGILCFVLRSLPPLNPFPLPFTPQFTPLPAYYLTHPYWHAILSRVYRSSSWPKCRPSELLYLLQVTQLLYFQRFPDSFAQWTPRTPLLSNASGLFLLPWGCIPPSLLSTRALRERTNCALLRINSFACHTCAFHGGRGVCVF
jgi:hypothetical protein